VKAGGAEFQIILFNSFLLCEVQSVVPSMRYAVLVTGPAGSGKSTFSNSFLTHLHTSKRSAHLVNLDPANTNFEPGLEPVIDIRDLISLEDVMGELEFGPNGGLVYCFE
jgi:GPN-loop GTPase